MRRRTASGWWVWMGPLDRRTRRECAGGPGRPERGGYEECGYHSRGCALSGTTYTGTAPMVVDGRELHAGLTLLRQIPGFWQRPESGIRAVGSDAHHEVCRRVAVSPASSNGRAPGMAWRVAILLRKG